MDILNIYMVLISILTFTSCGTNSDKNTKNSTVLPLQEELKNDTTIIDDYMIYNVVTHSKKHYYIKSIEATKRDMYRESELFYENVLCNQIEYRGEKAPIGYKKVFISNIKTNLSTLSKIIKNNDYVILSGICLSDTTYEAVTDSMKHISIDSKVRTKNPISFKYVEKMHLSSFDDETVDFIHNSDIDTLDLSGSSELKILDFKNTKINVLNISYSPNINLLLLKNNDLINKIIVYDDQEKKFIIVK